MTAPQTQPKPPYVVGGLRALSDIAWMARRQAVRIAEAAQVEVNEAIWLLHEYARSEHINIGHPDPTANRDYDETLGRLVEQPSFFVDGTPVDFTPDADRAAALKAMDRAEVVQWMVTVLHPLAHPYADGASTYAPGMLNDAARALRNAGFDLSATEALGKSVWVTDGMGDRFLHLTSEEIAERDAARAAAV